jgi:hypothetical protein
VIIVVASCLDQGAQTLAARQGTDRVALLTCEDLSVPGWRHYVAAAGPPVAVIDGREIALQEITGVITCLPNVSELELLHIVPADRAYVAAEMTAFLLSWLSSLSCPVINRPSPTCLSGPYWRPEQWAHLASRTGMRVQPVHRRVAFAEGPAPAAPESTTISVIGERCLGQADTAMLTGARRLARAANVETLTVRVSGPGPDATFLGADPWPDLTSQETADVLLEYVEERGRSRLPASSRLRVPGACTADRSARRTLTWWRRASRLRRPARIRRAR